MQLAWVRRDEAAALEVRGLGAPTMTRLRLAAADDLARLVRILPSDAIANDRSEMALAGSPGTYAVAGDALTFTPRFPFVEGRSYTVVLHPEVGGDGGNLVAATIVRPARPVVPTTLVTAVFPTAAVVPRNLLRFYVHFSAPMSEGFASQVTLVDVSSGRPLQDALLPMDQELWDPDRRRLTVLLDPARIKRGLVPHEEAGYPLTEGRSVRVEVGAGFRDALGQPLAAAGSRAYDVGPDLRGRVDPDRWNLTPPTAGTRMPLVVQCERPLDEALLRRAVSVEGVAGVGIVGSEERSWSFVPHAPWSAGDHRLTVDAVLEDIAGNSVARPFDRELARPEDAPVPSPTVQLPFAIW
jgi:hypothetical protein